MHAATDVAVVIDGGSGVEDSQIIDSRLRIDDHTGHDDDAVTDGCRARDRRVRTDRGRQGITHLAKLLAETRPQAIVAQGDDRLAISATIQLVECVLRSQYGHADAVR